MSSEHFLSASRWLISWPHKAGDQSQKCARDFGHGRVRKVCSSGWLRERVVDAAAHIFRE